MRPGETDNPDHQRRIGEPALLDVDVGCGSLRILSREHLCDDLAGANAGVAFEHNEAPRRQLAVIGYPRADRQNGFEFGRRGTRLAHLARFHGGANLQEFDGVGHRALTVSRRRGIARYTGRLRDIGKQHNLAERQIHRTAFARFTSGGVASSTSAASASSVSITFCPSLPSRRTDTECVSASFLPTTSSAGIFASECSRTL